MPQSKETAPVHIRGLWKGPGEILDTQALMKGLEREFHGALSLREIDNDGFLAEWDGATQASLLAAAEAGQLDRMARSYGVASIAEILCDGACFYQAIPAVPVATTRVAVQVISTDALKQKLRSAHVLLLTATPVEREAVHRAMTPWPGTGHILQGAFGPRVYHLGMLGRYPVAQTSSTMGSTGRQGSTITALQAINQVAPAAVILIGIAFGMDRVKQRLGDVIVAESIFPYELQRLGNLVSVRRGNEMQCGLVLSNRFREFGSDWRVFGGARDVRVWQGLMLSGDKLVDNEAFRDGLRAEFPLAFGGEMEGAGAYAAASETKTEMILVKAICDWADGHKDGRAQPFAAYAAVSLVAHVLGKLDALRALERDSMQGAQGQVVWARGASDPWAEIRRLAPDLYETGPTQSNVWSRAGGKLARINIQGDGSTAWDGALRILERGGGGTTLGQLVAVMCGDFPENEALQALARSLATPAEGRGIT